jgi:hypothetical protein
MSATLRPWTEHGQFPGVDGCDTVRNGPQWTYSRAFPIMPPERDLPAVVLVVPPGATVSCVQYVGCKPGYPVIFCTTTGVNPQHNPGDNSTTHITTDGMWNFWMSLPPASP